MGGSCRNRLEWGRTDYGRLRLQAAVAALADGNPAPPEEREHACEPGRQQSQVRWQTRARHRQRLLQYAAAVGYRNRVPAQCVTSAATAPGDDHAQRTRLRKAANAAAIARRARHRLGRRKWLDMEDPVRTRHQWLTVTRAAHARQQERGAAELLLSPPAFMMPLRQRASDKLFHVNCHLQFRP